MILEVCSFSKAIFRRAILLFILDIEWDYYNLFFSSFFASLFLFPVFSLYLSLDPRYFLSPQLIVSLLLSILFLHLLFLDKLAGGRGRWYIIEPFDWAALFSPMDLNSCTGARRDISLKMTKAKACQCRAGGLIVLKPLWLVTLVYG